MNENKQDIFEKLPVPKSVVTLALPTTISMIVYVLYNMVDAYFIGLTNDAEQVAAVSLAMPVFLIIMAFGNLFGIGASANISRYLGQKSYDKVKRISSFSVWTAFIVGVIVTVLGLTFMDSLVYAIGGDDTTYEYLKGYLTWLFSGSVFLILGSTLSFLLRSEGNTKQAMIGMLISTFTNIILDPIMIFVFGFGVVGAAMATVIANIIPVCYHIYTISNLKHTHVSIKLSDYKFDKVIAKDVLSIGIPAFLNTLLMSFSNIIYNNYLASYGTIPVAAMGIVFKLNMLPVMVFMGISSGIQPLLGYTYGAKLTDRLKETITFTFKIIVTFGTGCFLLYFFASEAAVGIFIDDAEVISQGAKMLKAQILSAPLLGLLFITTNLMQVTNRPLVALFLSICRQGVTFIPAVVILNSVAGLDGLIWAQALADVVCIIGSAIICVKFIISLNKNLEENLDSGEDLEENLEEIIEENSEKNSEENECIEV